MMKTMSYVAATVMMISTVPVSANAVATDRMATLRASASGASAAAAQNFAVSQVVTRCNALRGRIIAPIRTSVIKAGRLFSATAVGSCRYAEN